MPSLLCAEFAMCRVCYGPTLSCAEFAMGGVVPKSGYSSVPGDTQATGTEPYPELVLGGWPSGMA